MAFIRLWLEPKISKCSLPLICTIFSYDLEQVSNVTLIEKMDYVCNCKSEISNACNAVEGNCLQGMKIVHHYGSGYFDKLISWQLSVNPSKEEISTVLAKYKRFVFLRPVKVEPIPSLIFHFSHVYRENYAFSLKRHSTGNN